MILAGLGLMVAGVLAMLTHTIWLGLPGLVIFGAGALMALIATWRSVPWIAAGVAAVAVALIAAAPWLPWLDTRLFSWIRSPSCRSSRTTSGPGRSSSCSC